SNDDRISRAGSGRAAPVRKRSRPVTRCQTAPLRSRLVQKERTGRVDQRTEGASLSRAGSGRAVPVRKRSRPVTRCQTAPLRSRLVQKERTGRVDQRTEGASRARAQGNALGRGPAGLTGSPARAARTSSAPLGLGSLAAVTRGVAPG